MATYVEPVYPNPKIFPKSWQSSGENSDEKRYEDLEALDDDVRDRPLPTVFMLCPQSHWIQLQYEPVNWTINQITKDPKIAERMHEYYVCTVGGVLTLDQKRCIMSLPPTTRKEFVF